MAKGITPRAQYTLEFKEETVRLVESSTGMGEVARRVNMSDIRRSQLSSRQTR